VAKTRVHELAKTYGIESKEVLEKLKEMGEFVKSPSSTIELPVEMKFKKQYGEALLAPSVTKRLIHEFSRGPRSQQQAPAELEDLTPRELEVFALIARGMSNAEIAEELVVSETTVKTHVARVLMKLGVRDRVQAVVLAYESGVVAPGSTVSE